MLRGNPAFEAQGASSDAGWLVRGGTGTWGLSPQWVLGGKTLALAQGPDSARCPQRALWLTTRLTTDPPPPRAAPASSSLNIIGTPSTGIISQHHLANLGDIGAFSRHLRHSDTPRLVLTLCNLAAGCSQTWIVWLPQFLLLHHFPPKNNFMTIIAPMLGAPSLTDLQDPAPDVPSRRRGNTHTRSLQHCNFRFSVPWHIVACTNLSTPLELATSCRGSCSPTRSHAREANDHDRRPTHPDAARPRLHMPNPRWPRRRFDPLSHSHRPRCHPPSNNRLLLFGSTRFPSMARWNLARVSLQ